MRLDRPARPSTRYFRPFGLFTDGDDAIYVAKLAPKMTVTDAVDQKGSGGDDPVGNEVTLTATYNADAKTAGSPGWKAVPADMGFTAAPAADG
ncbi:hypothetical protein ACFWIW_26935 [Amycolatopsis sp. NPDC058340]|uniref:hypothetical protein n=1 Tax=Amycolatopsis sp. NPDC058340 TaxID=3346453 RepID=UPI003653F5BE